MASAPAHTDEFKRRVRNANHTIFVTYFDLIIDPSWSNERIIEHILEREPYSRAGVANRIQACRRLVKAGEIREALHLIAHSSHTKRPVRERAAELYASGDGAIEAGEFTVDVTKPTTGSNMDIPTRLIGGIKWYRAADGVLCADVRGKIAGAITLEIEPQPGARSRWIARARGFLAVVIHEIRGLPDEDTALLQIASWWGTVKA